MVMIRNSNGVHYPRGNYTQMSMEMGYELVEYDVTTEDGYILKLFYHKGRDKEKGDILLMHGLLDSADGFLLRGNTSHVGLLLAAGYSVWSGNVRGCRYGRRHVILNPDSDKKFWDYSFHEMGYYDLPALIDFILSKTGQQRIKAIAHSQGTEIFFVLGSTRPEYNAKISVLAALAPIAFVGHVKPPVNYIATFVPILSEIFQAAGNEELFGDQNIITLLFQTACASNRSYDLCAHGLIFSIFGSDPDEFEFDFYLTVIAHNPTGTSRKNFVHYYQNFISKSFSQFDYGPNNVDIYRSVLPPKYDLRKVEMRVVLFAGNNDVLSTIPDVKLLYKCLPNAEYFPVSYKRLTHIDVIWGRNMYRYLFPNILHVLENNL
ncbi:unnamed protein product [Leptidea sinapis]|uniref:Lipase n=2 Tax=Leptidea sinapis TaxID=189913 RepID=A0A5E4Q9B3_9NEOP|nr:unnamed protein product [Leptidea sinapis]